MLCPSCGRELTDGSVTCRYCGSDLKTEETSVLTGGPVASPRIGGERKDEELLRDEPEKEVQPDQDSHYAEQSGEEDSGSYDAEQSGMKAVAAIIAAVIFIVAGVFVYSSLPESRFKRYIKKARAEYDAGSYSEAAVIYHKALEIHDDSEEVLAELDELYGIVADRSASACRDGRFEVGAEEARTLFVIKPEALEQNVDALETVYRSWALYLAEQSTEAEVNALIEQASSELPQDSVDRIRDETDRAYQLKALGAQLSEAADRIRAADAGSDHEAVFRVLEEAYPLLAEYREKDGIVPVRFTDDSGENGTEFNTDGSSVQVYVGGLSSGRVRNGNARTYFISSAGTGNASYEFFEAEWSENDPNGGFRELDYGEGPGNPPTGVISGTVSDGHYDGDIRHTRGDVTYNMKFTNGKVEVLDTVDPNGDRNNVVGYTDDGDNWLVFTASALSSVYGVRYLR